MNKIQQARYGLTLSILILCIVLYIVYLVNKKNNEEARLVTESAQVIANLERIYAKINELESTQRGFIITRNPSFEMAFETIKTGLNKELYKLNHQMNLDDRQLMHAREIDSLITSHTIWLHDNMYTDSRGRQLMGSLAMLDLLMKITKMRDIEEAQMSKKTSLLLKWANWSAFVIIISVFVVAFLILIAYLILIREYGVKLNVEKELLSYQAQLNEKIEKLDMSNRDLEQFAYVASHDLQEPLRKILTFNEIINQKFEAIATPEIQNYLTRVSDAANRMRMLIDDLLTYSKSSRSGLDKSEVNLEEVLAISKENCEVRIQNRSARFIQNRKLPAVLGDKTQLVQVFQNLISNAIKFTKAEVTPVIHINTFEVNKSEITDESTAPLFDHYYKIVFQDNGIGFSDKDYKKIFVIFQRLNGRSEYEGTGIGLSICKKILENHQGYIRAQSEPSKGSNFIIYLPLLKK